MIISASRRTDIPCLYSEWFMNRIRNGFALVRNPFNKKKIYRISLLPEVIDCIVFWTKDASPMLPKLKELDKMGYTYYFQFTVTPYGKDIEPYLRPKNEIENTFIELSKLLGKHRIIWRYDPIILNAKIDFEFHKFHFTRMCEKFKHYTEQVTISFVDIYAKLKTPLVRTLTRMEIEKLAIFFAETAKKYELDITSCCENEYLSNYGIKKASCINKALIERLSGSKLNLPLDKNQRKNCGCFSSIDIGTYDTCTNGCVYCYANSSLKKTKQHIKNHTSHSPLITDFLNDDDTIIDRSLESSKPNILSLI